MTADVIVVGGGMAGLSAAVTAAELGATVVLFEKQPQLGGSTAMSGGLYAFAGTDEQHSRGIVDTPAVLREDLRNVGGHRNDPALVDAYATAQQETYWWLKSHGVRFTSVKLGSGQSIERSHHAAPTEVLRLLRAALDRTKQTTVLSGHRVSALSRDATQRVSAVEVCGPDGTRCVEARGGVVLTSGGFSRSRQLLEAFTADQAGAVPYGGAGNTGDGLRMAWRLGAGFRDTGFISGTYGSHPDTGADQHELLTAFYLGAIIVNTGGRRFADESQSYKILGEHCLRQPQQLGFQVFDSHVRAKSVPGLPLSDIDAIEALGHLVQADTLEQLADLAGIDSAGLVDTVCRYNDSVRGSSSDDFGRTSLSSGVGQRVPIETAPFYAYPAKTFMTSTYAGLTVTARTEVVDVDGLVIAGLFAAGEVTGGFHGVAPMTGASLAMSTAFGRIAGREAAAGRRGGTS